MGLQESGRIMRPTTVQPLSPELAREVQAEDLCRPTGWSVLFAEIVAMIADSDGHPHEGYMERGNGRG